MLQLPQVTPTLTRTRWRPRHKELEPLGARADPNPNPNPDPNRWCCRHRSSSCCSSCASPARRASRRASSCTPPRSTRPTGARTECTCSPRPETRELRELCVRELHRSSSRLRPACAPLRKLREYW